MICPNCFRSIPDDATYCPHCHEYVNTSITVSHGEFVYCEGCGARLGVRDRTCPKCGRPAPGILSTRSSSADLAAGKTASFPRLTREYLEAPEPPGQPSSAAQLINESIDPFATTVIDAADIEQKVLRTVDNDGGEDPYHAKKRPWKALVTALMVLALVGGAAAFVVYDPLGVIPGWVESFRSAARDMFPSRQVPEGSSSEAGTSGDSATDDTEEAKELVLTDDLLYPKLESIYRQIVSYGSEDRFGECVDAFNDSYLASKHATREQAASDAYTLRDDIQGTIDEIDGLKTEPDTVYSEDIDHLRQLAQWMYGRIDQVCESWDVSLSYEDGDSPSSHQDEILAPMRRAGSSDYESYVAHVSEWAPQEK